MAGLDLPGEILDEIHGETRHNAKKRSASKVLGRKSRRKEQRTSKKHKKVQDDFKGFSDDDIPEPEHKHKHEHKPNHKSVKLLTPEERKEQEELEYYASQLGINPEDDLEKEDDDDVLAGLLDGLEDEALAEQKKYEKKHKHHKRPSESVANDAVIDYDSAMAAKDDEALDYYAKKLGIDPHSNLKPEFEGDLIGDLLDGIGGDEEAVKSESSEQEASAESEESEAEAEHSEQDSIIESDDLSDFEDDIEDDDDLDDEERQMLREMAEIEGEDISEDESESDHSERENPYVAPTAYVPPALRKKFDTDSEKMQALKKAVKGPLNKMSEPNMLVSIDHLVSLFNDNPRQLVNEAIMKVVLESILVETPLLESFLMLYSSALVALYRSQGVDFGAYSIQTMVEKLNEFLEKEQGGNKVLNLVALLGFCYQFNLMDSALVYDIVRRLIENPTEYKTDLLLKLVRSSGTKLRSDDPTALKEIMDDLNRTMKGKDVTVRSRFLVETLDSIRKGKTKPSENGPMLIRVKKQLGRLGRNNSDAIKVSLDDIEKIGERGKWWLVGSAWKGREQQKETVDEDVQGDLELDTGPDWLELAKQQRMNTDVRRAIFISIMSATDFMDAFGKLDHLRLKKIQKREIPNILLHCATMETAYNPYYAYLSKKLCDDHAMRHEFQLSLWDLIKELDGQDGGSTLLEGDDRLSKILNLGRFFGFLIGEGALSLNTLRTVNFLTATSDARIFLEVLLIRFLDTVGKHSQEKAFGAGDVKSGEFSEMVLAERLDKCREQPLLLKGLVFFLNKHLKDSTLIKGKKQTRRVKWGIDTLCELIDSIV